MGYPAAFGKSWVVFFGLRLVLLTSSRSMIVSSQTALTFLLLLYQVFPLACYDYCLRCLAASLFQSRCFFLPLLWCFLLSVHYRQNYLQPSCLTGVAVNYGFQRNIFSKQCKGFLILLLARMGCPILVNCFLEMHFEVIILTKICAGCPSF